MNYEEMREATGCVCDTPACPLYKVPMSQYIGSGTCDACKHLSARIAYLTMVSEDFAKIN